MPDYLHNDPSMSGPITHSGAWQNWWEETGSQPRIPAEAPNAFPLRSPAPAPSAPPAGRSRRGRRESPDESFDDLRAPERPRGSGIDSSSGTYSRLRPPPEPPAYPRPGSYTPSYDRPAPPRRPDDSGRIGPPTGTYGRLSDSSAGLGRLSDSSAGLGRLSDSSTGLGRLSDSSAGLGRLSDSSAGLGRLDSASSSRLRRPEDPSASSARLRRPDDSGRIGPDASSARLRRPEDATEMRRRLAGENQLGSIDGGRKARRGGATRADLVQGSTALAPAPERDEITDTGARRARSTFHVAEEPEPYDEPSLVLQWGVFLLQTLTAAAAGLGVWLGFYRLWSTWPFYAAPAVGAAMVGMLAVARLLRRRYGHELDLLTAIVTVAVGTVLTVLPAAFTLQSIA